MLLAGGVAHLVRPAHRGALWTRAVLARLDRVLLGDELDALLLEHCSVGTFVLTARVCQRLLDLVSELPIELGDVLSFALVLPERPLIHAHRPLDDIELPLPEESVVDLRKLVMLVGESVRLTRLVVVVEHEDVVVRMTTTAVDMSDHERVAVGKQLLAELVPQVVDLLHVLRLTRVELFAGEALHDGPCLDLATVDLSQTFTALDELLDRLGVHPHRRDSIGAVFKVGCSGLRVLPPVHHVVDTAAETCYPLRVHHGHRVPPNIS